MLKWIIVLHTINDDSPRWLRPRDREPKARSAETRQMFSGRERRPASLLVVARRRRRHLRRVASRRRDVVRLELEMAQETAVVVVGGRRLGGRLLWRAGSSATFNHWGQPGETFVETEKLILNCFITILVTSEILYFFNAVELRMRYMIICM